MGKKIKKNLNQIIKGAMHRPLSSSGFVLYPKVEGYTGSEEGETQAEKDTAYIAQSKSNHNSPTNIRKVFITGDSVTVQYYTPMVIKNSSNSQNGHWKTVKYSKENNLFEIATAMLNYNKFYSQYLMEKTINNKAVEPNNYYVVGNGLGVIANPWVCSNIEEIYFDWTLLLSSEVAPYFGNYASSQAIMSFITKSAKASEIKNEEIIKYFSAFTSGGIKDLRKRYPRLRTIAMISNLKDVLEHPSMIKVDHQFSNIEESKKTWYEANRNLIAQSNSLVLMGDLTDSVDRLNKEFIVKDNIYKFDFDKLNGEVKRFIIKIDDYKRQKEYGNTAYTEEQDTNLLEASELENKLLEIEKEYGEKVLKNILIYAINGSDLKTKEILEVFKTLTKPNRQRIASMINLVIK